jgi:ubiquinone/menaquinone biosynthesis C-methylase UbiE
MLEPIVATKQVIEQLFDDAATSYNRIGPSVFTQFGTRLVEQMPLKQGACLLDVATGTLCFSLPRDGWDQRGG